MSLFIILDNHEQSGWNERNKKRDMYMQAHIHLGSERSLKKAIRTLKRGIAEALRLKVLIDYEIVDRCAFVLRSRDIGFVELYTKYHGQDESEPTLKRDALHKLDELLSDAESLCELHIALDNSSAIINQTDGQVETFAAAANAAFPSWEKSGGAKGGDQSTDVKCNATNCKKKLSKRGADVARKYSEKNGTVLSKHTCICDTCFEKHQKAGTDKNAA
jgi:hypothetical protein